MHGVIETSHQANYRLLQLRLRDSTMLGCSLVIVGPRPLHATTTQCSLSHEPKLVNTKSRSIITLKLKTVCAVKSGNSLENS